MITLNGKFQKAAFRVGHQFGLRASSEAMYELAEQLRYARAELQEARAEYAAKIERTREHFNSEAAAMRKELTSALAEIDQLRRTMFQKWERHPTDPLN